MDSLRARFRQPPGEFGPVPFYWWTGEKLDRRRIAWQLDQLCAKGVRQTVISYPHGPEGTTDVGDPPLFSAEWWDLFRWFLGECRKRGMTVGFQDYTLVMPLLLAIGRETEDMQGGQMSCASETVAGPCEVRLAAEKQTHVIGAWAYPVDGGAAGAGPCVDLSAMVRDGELLWSAPAGNWLVSLVYARLNPFDPLHPESGALAIRRLYEPFERECPGEIGKTLNLFFQDELDFGCRMPFWSNRLLDVFVASKGYDIRPLLPALWHDIGPATAKIRLDYADVVTARCEACYFEPVFRWHESRGILFGHDNCGRGRIAEGRDHYGDYFRTMRWYSAPGCDDPKLQGARSFRGLKVNSSIASLYGRARVWIEAFHSSGWGTRPAEILAAIREDFAYGATVVNLHGLYYSTRGGWWEWAPPDFHFRQPYWEHSGILNGYLTRLSWLLSQGAHQSDVAMVYPIDALDAESADPAAHGLKAHMGNQALGAQECDHPQPEQTAFDLGKYLFDRACDFDFIDHQSVARAVVERDGLSAGGSRYRVLILPAMPAVRYATLEKALEFARAGGMVVAYGCLPVASERAGSGDERLSALLRDLFGTDEDAADGVKHHPGGGRGVYIRRGFAAVMRAVDDSIARDVLPGVTPLHVLHRRSAVMDCYFLFNPTDERFESDVRFRADGHAEEWDAWTGDAFALDSVGKDPSLLRVSLAPRDAMVIVFHREQALTRLRPRRDVGGVDRVDLDGDWRFSLAPTLDNRFGDFRLPPTEGLLGPEARRFKYAEEFEGDDITGWASSEFDDSQWRETTYSFGQHMQVLGPLPPGRDFLALEAGTAEDGGNWRPYEFSLRWGIERDPFLTDWLSGPHGLKGRVPDEYLDFECDTPGSIYYLRAQVGVAEDRDVILCAGARCAYRVWVDGVLVAEQTEALPPGRFAPWNIPHYECEPQRVPLRLSAGSHRLMIKLVQPDGQRTRAFVAFDPAEDKPGEPALRWFRDPRALRPSVPAAPGRRAVWFRFLSPPGVKEIHFVARGAVRAWADGTELDLKAVGKVDDECVRYVAKSSVSIPSLARIVLRVTAPPDSHGGDILPEPVCFCCDEGMIAAGDWCGHGLACYSGAADYRKEFELPVSASAPGNRLILDLGEVMATADVAVNGRHAGSLLAPPWTVDITDFARPGRNELRIRVANTLANHYSVGIPTPYAFPEQTRSGLIGPVRLLTNPPLS